MYDLSWLNPTPHAIAVYASHPLSPVATQHSLPSGRYPLLGPDFDRLDRTSFAWRTYSMTSSARSRNDCDVLLGGSLDALVPACHRCPPRASDLRPALGRLPHLLQQCDHVGHLPLGTRARKHALELGAEGRAPRRGRGDVGHLAYRPKFHPAVGAELFPGSLLWVAPAAVLRNCLRFRTSESGWVSPLKKMAKCSQRPNTVANDLGNRQHGHGKDRARNTPHPEPEDERDDDEDGSGGEAPGQKNRRYSLT